MCAMAAAARVASTMGFTALDGLPMGTRTAAIDPGVLLYLVQQKGMGGKRAGRPCCTSKSGLLGVSGISNDMRVLLASDDPRPSRRSICSSIASAENCGSLAAALGGSTRWCSPPASANAPRRCERRFAACGLARPDAR